MSHMLEQAIVDAKALKEAAFNSAKDALVEKYAPEIKQAVNAILEQEEDEMGLGDEEALGDLAGEEGGEESNLDLPLAATAGEKLCPCPDEEEEIEIDFDQLEKQMQMSDEEEEPISQAELATDLDLGGGEEDELALQEEFELEESDLLAMLQEKSCGDDEEYTLEEEEELPADVEAVEKAMKTRIDSNNEIGPLLGSVVQFVKNLADEGNTAAKTALKNLKTQMPDVVSSINEEEVLQEYEQWEMDTDGPHGWGRYIVNDEGDKDYVGPATGEPPTQSTGGYGGYGGYDGGRRRRRFYEEGKKKSQNESLNLEARIQKAVLSETKKVESGLLKENKKLQSEKDSLIKENANLKTKSEEFKSKVLELSETLESVNLNNARLFYTNKVLTSTSLNERQKDKIAEAISRAGSVDEAKTVFDTLVDSVGSSNERRTESLNEVVGNKRTGFVTRQNKTTHPEKNRWQALAGIKK